jgi:hypothetical protein
MSSEWMKVMLDEIARKKVEAEQDRIEFERRVAEQGASDGPGGGPAGSRPPGGLPHDST